MHEDAERPGAQFQVTEQPCLGGEFAVRQGLSSACVLCARRLATVLTDEAPSAVIATGFEQRLRLGQVLYTAGRRSDAVFVMRRGLAKEVLDSGYARRVVRLVGPRSVTGLSALVGEPHRHTAVVIGAGLACRIPVAALAEWGGRDLRASARVGRLWQQALDDADRLIASYGCGPAAARLARYVLFLTETVGSGARLCRREAAELLGVTPVSVTRLVGDLKRQGLIREQGASLTAWDSSGLQALAAQGEPGLRPGVLSEALAANRR